MPVPGIVDPDPMDVLRRFRSRVEREDKRKQKEEEGKRATIYLRGV